MRRPITEFPLFMETVLEGLARWMVNNCLAWALLRMKRTRGIDIYMQEKGGHKHVRRRMLRKLRVKHETGAQRARAMASYSICEQRILRFRAELFPVWRARSARNARVRPVKSKLKNMDLQQKQQLQG